MRARELLAAEAAFAADVAAPSAADGGAAVRVRALAATAQRPGRVEAASRSVPPSPRLRFGRDGLAEIGTSFRGDFPPLHAW